MPACKFCGKQYDVNDSSANNYKQYCSRSCELRGISAAKDRENALIAAEAADDQARAYYEAADAAREQADAERERANAEYERANAEREKAKAYDRLRKSNERMEEERKTEVKEQKEQEIAREDLEDKCGMFVTRKIWDEEGKELEVKVREATGGTREYKLGQCEVKEYPDEKSIEDGNAELVVHVNSLLNKTPKGSGPLHFCVYYFQEDFPDQFVEKEDSATGITYWGRPEYKPGMKISGVTISREGYDGLMCCRYQSKDFFLKQGKNIEDKNFTLLLKKAPPDRLDSYNVYLTLEERTYGNYDRSDNGDEGYTVAWTKIDTVNTFDDTYYKDFYGYYGKKGAATEFGGSFDHRGISRSWYRTNNNKKKYYSYIDVFNKLKPINNAKGSASLYLKLTLKEFGTEKVINWNRSDYFTLGKNGSFELGKYANFVYENEQEFDYDAVYEAELKLYEVDAADGKGRCVHSENFYHYPMGVFGYEIIDGEEWGKYFKGQKLLAANNSCIPEISIKGARYTIKDDKEVTIEIDRVENESDYYPTGSLVITLLYQTKGKIKIAARLVKNYLKAGHHYNSFEETVKYTRPKDYCDDSIPMIRVVQIATEKKLYFGKAQVKFLSVNQQKQRDAEQKTAEERRIAEAKKQEAARKAAEARWLEQQKQEKIKKEKEKKARFELRISNELSTKLMFVCYASFFLWFASYWSYRGLSDSFGNIISTLILSIFIGGLPVLFLYGIGLIGIPVYFVWGLTGLPIVQSVLLTIILALPSFGLGFLIKKFVKGNKLYRLIAKIATAATVVIPIALIVFFKVVKH